ncbi:type VI secretion system baseplate subunit TssG [Hoeflea ulvae]|uniref:Type VI secretion system baseplate subunit TssG n=1 Tax=Hoeflea ulvae TaxID=2983764 RepID=A0ABT3YH12_9HYPH|nr:type VI secretion system baseplate subunit TssG [Hoeflea ulvae]MCY0095186.1 type VI secretion system baseplate subunit TssG [Hoeflea ulvae]
MKLIEDIKADPFRHNFYAVLREFERHAASKPRIGDGVTVKDDIVVLSQDPYTAFPASNIAAIEPTPSGGSRLSIRFLGMFGPQGALPLHITETSQIWANGKDPSFARFVDVLSTRFLQLFYRAWADSRPIAQFERPELDRFQVFLASFGGVGTETMRHADARTQIGRIPYTGLVNSHVKSASRLKQLLQGLLKLDVEIEQWVGTWLSLDVTERTAMGRQSARLGVDSFVGKRIYSITEKFRIRIRCRDQDEYERLLPGSALASELADLAFYYVGYRAEFDVELGLPRDQAPSIRLGSAGKLGLTSWLQGARTVEGPDHLFEARFNPMAPGSKAGQAHA